MGILHTWPLAQRPATWSRHDNADALIHRLVPLLQGIRAPVRFGFLVLVAVAALAAFGLAWLCRRCGDRHRLRLALGLSAAVLVTVEAARFPLAYAPRHVVPEVYRALLLEVPGAVVELPLPPPAVLDRSAPSMLNSTVHWRPLVNGFSGFLPKSCHERRADLALFPDPGSLAVLRRLGVRYVVIHREEFSERFVDALARVDESPDPRLVAAAGDIAIYRVLP